MLNFHTFEKPHTTQLLFLPCQACVVVAYEQISRDALAKVSHAVLEIKAHVSTWQATSRNIFLRRCVRTDLLLVEFSRAPA